MSAFDVDSLPAFSSRRQFVNRIGAGAIALALGPVAGSAEAAPPASTDLVTRMIPRTGEFVPAIGMGSFMTFDVLAGQPRDNLREVLRRSYEGGGRVVDTSPLYGNSEVNVGELSGDLGLTDKLFFTDKMCVTGEYLSDDSHARRSLYSVIPL
ncbi:MAG TPA: twin-arginine translocation signal domain-containing protein [Planctomycetaceae bacterium]|jgi:hypothetical protein|nr:twin-arginine translocation signal domain-containing protein [Planctomycetaceae bacterium]